MELWITRVNGAAGPSTEGGAAPSRAQTMPARSEEKETGKKPFFTMKKK